jgi:hypothetical protein
MFSDPNRLNDAIHKIPFFFEQMNTGGLSPLSEQQADALPVMRPTYTFCDHGANINSNEFATERLMLVLRNCIRYLGLRNGEKAPVYY